MQNVLDTTNAPRGYGWRAGNAGSAINAQSTQQISGQ